MYDVDRFFNSVDHHLIAWIGTLSPEELETYLDEPGGRRENEPQSEFARDLGRWYDHDFIYAQAADRSATIAELAKLNYLTDEKLIRELESHASTQNPLSCFVILWNAKRIDMCDREFARGKLACIGSWPHQALFTG